MFRKILMIFAALAVNAGIAHANDGWEATIIVESAQAENKLAIGMKTDAQDGVDPGYDIPAFLAEKPALLAYLELGGGNYWRDVKAVCGAGPCDKVWDVFVESSLGNQLVRLRWDPKAFPQDMMVSLTDTAAGAQIDMKSGTHYSYRNNGKRRFKVEVKR